MEEYLSSDIMREIMMKMPFKSVVRMMCTSRYWYGEIRSLEFSKAYLKKTIDSDTDRCVLLSTAAPSRTAFFRLPIDDEDQVVGDPIPTPQPLFSVTKCTEVVGHSNGLVCICSHSYPDLFSGFSIKKLNDAGIDDCELAIWNPSIARFKTVPTLPWFELPNDRCCTTLRYPPSYGFAYNPRADDYEIIQIRQIKFEFYLESRFDTEVWIYSLRTDLWRRIADLDKRYEGMAIAIGIFGKALSCPNLNGHLHWKMDGPFPFMNEWKVLAFDVENERFLDYEIPRLPPAALSEIELQGPAGHKDLFVLRKYYQQWVYMILVWRMEEHGDVRSWVRQLHCMADTTGMVPLLLLPLLRSKAFEGRLTLYLVNEEPNPHFSVLFWLDSETRERHFVRRLESFPNFRGVSFVPSFMLADGEPVQLH